MALSSTRSPIIVAPRLVKSMLAVNKLFDHSRRIPSPKKVHIIPSLGPTVVHLTWHVNSGCKQGKQSEVQPYVFLLIRTIPMKNYPAYRSDREWLGKRLGKTSYTYTQFVRLPKYFYTLEVWLDYNVINANKFNVYWICETSHLCTSNNSPFTATRR